jgi:hypothetical protein
VLVLTAVSRSGSTPPLRYPRQPKVLIFVRYLGGQRGGPVTETVCDRHEGEQPDALRKGAVGGCRKTEYQMRNKRYLAPVIAGVVVFGAVTAFAAGFTVTSNTVVSGNANVTGCNAAAKVSYTTIWGDQPLASPALNGPKAYVVKTAPVTTDAKCAGMAYHVTLQDAANKSLGEVSGTLDALTGNAAPDFTSQYILASDVAGISITVTG